VSSLSFPSDVRPVPTPGRVLLPPWYSGSSFAIDLGCNRSARAVLSRPVGGGPLLSDRRYFFFLSPCYAVYKPESLPPPRRRPTFTLVFSFFPPTSHLRSQDLPVVQIAGELSPPSTIRGRFSPGAVGAPYVVSREFRSSSLVPF